MPYAGVQLLSLQLLREIKSIRRNKDVKKFQQVSE